MREVDVREETREFLDLSFFFFLFCEYFIVYYFGYWVFVIQVGNRKPRYK